MSDFAVPILACAAYFAVMKWVLPYFGVST